MYINSTRSQLIGGIPKCSYCQKKIKRGKKLLRVEFEQSEISSRAIHRWCAVKMLVKALVKRVEPAKKYQITHKRICIHCGRVMSVKKTYLSWMPKTTEDSMHTRCFKCIEEGSRDVSEIRQS